jgi:hypothetical protein
MAQLERTAQMIHCQELKAAGQAGLEPTTNGFGDHYSTN